MDQEEVNQDAMAAFMNITGCGADRAVQFLELTNWQLDEAVILFMESNSSASATSSQDTAASQSTAPPPAPYDTSEVRAPDPFKRQRLVGDIESVLPRHRIRNSQRDFAAESIDLVRQHMMPAAAASVRSAFAANAYDTGGGSNQRLNELFEPPMSLMFQGTYSEARAAAIAEEKWLLVNIQDEIVFHSHMLNRDTWSDDLVQNVVASGFIFQQHYFTSEAGKKFCTLYQIEREMLPIIAIIHPRKGEIVHQWVGFIGPQDLAERLSDFSSSNDINDTTNRRVQSGNLSTSTSYTDITNASEDEQLNAAIAASLVEEVVDVNESKEDLSIEDQVEEVLPPEPTNEAPEVTRIQFRTPDGARVTRRFNKTDPIRYLMIFVKEQIPDAKTRAFEIRTAFPPAALDCSQSASISEKKLENSSLIIKWI